MKPAFALSLSQDGITLLHRTETGWETVGIVNPEAEGLDAAMMRLRDVARGLEPKSFTTKLVLPQSQILFTDIDAPGPDRAARRVQIARALEGRTPYNVNDLVFDWSGNGRVVRTAVVAKVTLDEAESFAEHYGFHPVCFVADPDGGSFAGEPWFGQTSTASRHLPEGARVTRDQDPVGVARFARTAEMPAVANMPEPAPVASVTDVPQGEEAPFIAVEDTDAGPRPGDTVGTDVAEDRTVSIAQDTSADDRAETVTEATQHVSDAPPPESVTAGIIASAPDQADWLEPTDDKRRYSAPAATFASRRDPVEASIGDEPRLTARPTRIDIAAPAASAVPRLGGAVQDAGATVDVPVTSHTEVRAPSAKRADGFGARPTATAKALRRVLARAGAVPKPVLRHPRKAPEAEAAELTVFGARRTAGARQGASRYVGLMLAAGLLVVMLGVGLWSMLFDRTPSATTTAATDTTVQVPPAPAMTPDSTADAQTADPAPDLNVVETDPEADVTPPADDPAAVEQDVATDAPTGDSATPVATDSAPDAAAEAAATAAAAALASQAVPPAEIAAAAPATAAPSPAPSLWSAAPGSGKTPEPDDIAVLRPSANDPAKTGAATLLPDAETLQHDPVLAAQPEPVPFDQLLRYDAAGLIIPTPQGVVSPDGFTVYAGKPPVVAKVRPANLKPPVTAVEIPLAPVDPTIAQVPNPLLGKKPLPRPIGLVVIRQGDAALPSAAEPLVVPPADQIATQTPVTAPDAEAATVALPDPRLVGFKPKYRPTKIAAVAAAAAEARNAIADAAAAAAGAEQAAPPDTGATRYAVATSRRPTERPSRLSQGVEAALAMAATSAVTDAAAALPEPAATGEAAPAQPEVTAALPEVDEPEPVSAAPSIPTRASVAKQATIKNVMDLGRVNLIGVYGSSADRRAMVRMPSGRFVKVQIGDVLDGGRVAAISDTALSYVKGGRTIVLKMIRDS